MTAKKIIILKVILLLIFLVLGITVLSTYGKELIDSDNIRSLIDDSGFFGPLIFIFIYIVGTLLFFPGTPLTISSGVLFGTVKGTIYVIIGATLGASLTFMISRFLGREFITRILEKRVAKLGEYDAKIENNGFFSHVFP